MRFKCKASNTSMAPAPLWLKILAYGGLVFLHFPIAVILLNAFLTSDGTLSANASWLSHFTLHWFSVPFAREDVISALLLSLKVASMSSLLAIIMDVMAEAAIYKRNFFWQRSYYHDVDFADCLTRYHYWYRVAICHEYVRNFAKHLEYCRESCHVLRSDDLYQCNRSL